MQSKQDRQRPPPKSIAKLIGDMSGRHHSYQVFSDFVEMAAISIGNAVDKPQFNKREARYMEIVKRYQPEELQQFPMMMGELVNELEEKPSDVLGRVFHELELHNKYTGQFFTPYPLCQMMAKIQVGDGYAKSIIEERGFLTASEPACGSGAMVIAIAHALRDEGINYQHCLHVTATDVDAKCVHMAYLQLSLLHVPAVIVHGNTISLEEWAHWFTPAHIMGGWDRKLRNREAAAVEPVKAFPIQSAPERPIPVAAPSQLSLF